MAFMMISAIEQFPLHRKRYFQMGHLAFPKGTADILSFPGGNSVRSVRVFPLLNLWVKVWMQEVCPSSQDMLMVDLP